TEQKNNVNDISVYVRDLNNGPVIGVDQNFSFAPASLLKVPMLIAYLKWSEDNPKILEEKFEFKKKIDVGYTQQFAPAVPLEEGKTYTAQELLESMIKYSDNQALVLLFERLPRKYQEDLYVLLGVDPKLITDPNARLTTKQYSVFFRILFNSSFLSQKNSEYALKLLSETSFTDGLRSVIPTGITVSHKFGERKTKDGLQQFHDCGIVYYPKHPQLVCVMTKGGSVDDLIKSIREVSGFVYDKIHTQYKEDF
ncbi:MAG: beta-lactamase class, partial [Patescibacteria group bacterium]|nr:beta-lactamase class [Patescibacteria group bacterium]